MAWHRISFSWNIPLADSWFTQLTCASNWMIKILLIIHYTVQLTTVKHNFISPCWHKRHDRFRGVSVDYELCDCGIIAANPGGLYLWVEGSTSTLWWGQLLHTGLNSAPWGRAERPWKRALWSRGWEIHLRRSDKHQLTCTTSVKVASLRTNLILLYGLSSSNMSKHLDFNMYSKWGWVREEGFKPGVYSRRTLTLLRGLASALCCSFLGRWFVWCD